jgi:sugar/nucleoside kinase (ribokinase family)
VAANILVFGTVCIDRVRSVPHLPPTGGYVEIASETVMLGGEAANTALALKTWGADVELWGNSIGTGADGQTLNQLLQRKDLKVHFQTSGVSSDTPVCDIYVTPNGDRTMFGLGFAEMEKGIEVSAVPMKRDGWITLEPNMSNAARELAVRAAEAGMRIYVMDFPNPGDIPPGSFWQSSVGNLGLVGNESERLDWVRKWVAETGCFAVLSDGHNGFIAGSNEYGVRSYPAFPAPRIVDSTGAGDTFRAGMLYGLSLNWAIAECLEFAAAAGALACGSLGATDRVPTRSDIQVLISRCTLISQEYRTLSS